MSKDDFSFSTYDIKVARSAYRLDVNPMDLLPRPEDFIGTKATMLQLTNLQKARTIVLQAFKDQNHPFVKAAMWLRYERLCCIGTAYVPGKYDPIFIGH